MEPRDQGNARIYGKLPWISRCRYASEDVLISGETQITIYKEHGMFRDALFQVGSTTFVLPIREWEISRIQREYSCIFVMWL